MHVPMHKYECMYLLTDLLAYLPTLLTLAYLLTCSITYLPTLGTYILNYQGAESMQKLLQPQMLARQSDRSAPERPQRHSRDTQNGSQWIRKHLQIFDIFLKSNKYNYIYIYIHIFIYLLVNINYSYIFNMFHYRSSGVHPMAAIDLLRIPKAAVQRLRGSEAQKPSSIAQYCSQILGSTENHLTNIPLTERYKNQAQHNQNPAEYIY